jgi:protein-S-isoprenylcysteine O-methyltransferase Ste14
MHVIGQLLLGALMLLLLVILIAVKQMATGSIFERAPRHLLLWLVNAFNLLFLVVINPLAGILLLARKYPAVDGSRLTITPVWFLTIVEITGAAFYLGGFLLMGWALITLGRSYQLGGSTPRAVDQLIVRGPYAAIRHPMYTAALGIALGLFGLTQSLAGLAIFLVYLALILLLIPVEEESVVRAYGDAYVAYQRVVKRLIPHVY